jgi:hypothetical protein
MVEYRVASALIKIISFIKSMVEQYRYSAATGWHLGNKDLQIQLLRW